MKKYNPNKKTYLRFICLDQGSRNIINWGIDSEMHSIEEMNDYLDNSLVYAMINLHKEIVKKDGLYHKIIKYKEDEKIFNTHREMKELWKMYKTISPNWKVVIIQSLEKGFVFTYTKKNKLRMVRYDKDESIYQLIEKTGKIQQKIKNKDIPKMKKELKEGLRKAPQFPNLEEKNE